MADSKQKEAQKLVDAGVEYIRAMTAIRRRAGDDNLTGRVMAQFTMENIEFILGAVQVLDPERTQKELLRRLAAASVVDPHEAEEFYCELVSALLPDPLELPLPE